ncbi:MAG: hypothetical protein ACPGXL_03255 [Chitinophagales bacterium]
MNRLTQLEAFLKESPKDPFLKYAIALEYLKQNKEDKTLTIFIALTKEHPNYVGTYYHLGKLQEKLGEEETALQTYQKGMVIAEKMNDGHSHGELKGAYQVLYDELYFEI